MEALTKPLSECIGDATRFTVEHGAVLDNIRSAVARRDLEWFVGAPRRPDKCIIAAGGPSLADTSGAYRLAQGLHVAINAAPQFLRKRGCRVDACVLLDPDPYLADLIEPHPTTAFYVASQCDPAVFDRLKGCRVILWHADNGLGEERRILDGTGRPWVAFGGGSTAALRCINLFYGAGYRRFEFHGMDSSIPDDGEGAHHAYGQPDLGDKRIPVRVAKSGRPDRTYITTPALARQAQEFLDVIRRFGFGAAIGELDPIAVTVKGTGLLPHINRMRLAQ